jgi:BlaI family transcriptional regulator, penicillinase repressor
MGLTKAEWQIMNALWKKYPASARDVIDNLEEDIDWAYTTVKTMLDRLAKKGVLKVRKERNVSMYEPLVSQRKTRQAAIRTFVNQVFEGAVGPLMHHLITEKELSEKEKEELVRILKEEEEK